MPVKGGKACHFWFQCRTQLAITLFLGYIICYLLRVDINVTILTMVNDTSAESSNGSSPFQTVCAVPDSESFNGTSTRISVGTYQWDRPTQGLILGAFFWGYIFTQIPGGLLSFHLGPRWVGFTSILLCSILDLFVPTAASISPYLLIVTRILQGLAQGVIIPTVSCLVGRWIPPSERSRTTAFVNSGMQLGTVVGLALAGFLSEPRLADDGISYVSYWVGTHYLIGSVGIVYVILWYFVVYDAPDTHPRIGDKELSLIQTELWGIGLESSVNLLQTPIRRGTSVSVEFSPIAVEPESLPKPTHTKSRRPPVPWFSLLCSRPFWSVLVCHVCYNWSWYTLITCMPTYMSRVLGFSMTNNGLLSSIPYLVQCAFAQVVGFTSDQLVKRGKLSTTWVRKLNNCIALGGIGTGLLLVGYIGCSRIGAVVIFATAIGLMGASSSGYPANAVDLAPQFSGVIISLTNTVATLPGIFGPMLVGYVTKESSSLENWRLIYGVATGIAWFGATFNLFMTSGRKQPWANPVRTAGVTKWT
uniref:Sialin-like 2 n=1 Tax=Cryptocotyle lingua TaxID=66766 RepID=A0A7U0YEY4_9TREM|nr:sialin-like 2 [Cryptocotyle lingua]